MAPLIVLLSVFGIALLWTSVRHGRFGWARSGRIAMSAMLVFTAFGHLMFTSGMVMMLPDFVPYKTEVIYLTAVMEIAFAVGLFVPRVRVVVAWLLVVFFILTLPANIHASLKQIDYRKGTFDGYGLTYLWFRVPLQIFFMGWTYAWAVNKRGVVVCPRPGVSLNREKIKKRRFPNGEDGNLH